MDYRLEVKDLNVYFDESHILKDINININKNMVTHLLALQVAVNLLL